MLDKTTSAALKSNRFQQGRVTRACVLCGEQVQYLPTDAAPRGAWVESGTSTHHHCVDLVKNHIRSIMGE